MADGKPRSKSWMLLALLALVIVGWFVLNLGLGRAGA
jgi:hypothetical protein